MKNKISIFLIVSLLFTMISVSATEAASKISFPTHVVINQVYGGGQSKNSQTPISNAFIELYNPTDQSVNLDGWSVQYADRGADWNVLSLKGEIAPKCSFLIKGNTYNNDARLKIDKYDLQWNIDINNKGCKVLLKKNAQQEKSVNPFLNIDENYVDMLGVAGNSFNYFIDGFEKDYAQIQSKQKAIRRINFQDTDCNAKDFVAIDYRTADLEEVHPRYSGNGPWTYTAFVRTKDISHNELGDTEKSKFSFLHVSDTQGSTKGQFEGWGKLTSLMKDMDFDFTIHTGDITDNPDNVQEMDMFYQNSGTLTDKPFIGVVGNHDQKSNTFASLFKQYFAKIPGNEAPSPVTPGTTASFDYGDAHFIILNTESDLTTQKKWLEEELKSTNKKWKIVAMHRSPYGAVGINDTITFTEIFDKYHVDLVIHGHDHLYLRSVPLYNGKKTNGGTIYLESGSSGSKQENGIVKQSYDEVCISPKSPTFSNITVSEDTIKVVAQCIDENGFLNTIDEFEIKKYIGNFDNVTESNYNIPNQYFSDIRSDREYRDSVMLLSQLGIIKKDTSFLPNKEISGAEFSEWLNKADGSAPNNNNDENITFVNGVKMILERLGYDKYIEVSNQQYDSVAKDIGLYRNIDYSNKSRRIKKSEAAVLIANALETNIIEVQTTSDNSSYYAQVYKTWLNFVHNTYKMTGIITDRPYYTKNSSPSSVKFENSYGEKLTVGYTEEIYNLLGYEIEAYIKNPNNGGKMIYGVKTQKNNVLEIKKSRYGEISDVNDYIIFSYYTDAGNSKKIKIDSNAEFIYNESRNDKIKQNTLNKEKNAFKPSHIGKIKLIDCNDDNVYDFVFIDNYKDMLVSGVDSDARKVTNYLKYNADTSVKSSKYNEISSILLDETDNNYKVSFCTPEEKPTSFSSITKNSVISVALSSLDDDAPETALVRRVYVSNTTVKGTVTSIFEDDEDDYYIVEGKAYRMSKSYYNTYNKGESINNPAVNIGDAVSFYLDYDERIAFLENNITEKQIGIILKTTYDDFNNEYALNVFENSGNAEVYHITKKKYMQSGIDAISLPALVQYNKNDEYITNINKDMKFAESGNMISMLNTSRLGNYFYDSNTLMFLYEGDKADANSNKEENYSIITSDYLKNKKTYNVDVYAVEKHYYPQIVIIYDNDVNIDFFDNIMVVTSVTTTLNNYGDNIYKLYGMENGNQISLYLLPEITVAPQIGSVIHYKTNANGDIKAWKEICNTDTADFEVNSIADDVSYAKCSSPVSVYNNIITVNTLGSYTNYYTDESTVVYYLYNEKNQYVNTTTVDSITNEDKLFIVLKEGIASEVFVWKNK